MRENWPAELHLNFTALLSEAGSRNLSFDNSSIRVFEYNSSGSIIYSVPFQFDPSPDYVEGSNAVGELVFIINGTTPMYGKRTYFVYFDSIAEGRKTSPTFTTNLAYNWGGKELNVNNSLLWWYLDTGRGENTTGLYRVTSAVPPFTDLFDSAPNERTFEYAQYTNDTSNFTFQLANNISFISGPVRLTVILQGNESYWNDPNTTTGDGYLTKKYRFYDLGRWIKVEQEYSDTNAANSTRFSTPSGALAFESERLLPGPPLTQDGPTDPYSWSHASDAFNSIGIGIISAGENSTANYVSMKSDGLGRIGINLSQTTLLPGSSIGQSAIIRFTDTAGELNQLQNLSASLTDGIALNLSAAEAWMVNTASSSNASIFNRNETVVVRLTVTSDIFGFVSSANATLDNGTISIADDFNISLYDDGSHNDLLAGDGVFGNNFTLNDGATVGIWNITARTYGPDLRQLSLNSSVFNVTDIYTVNLTIFNTFGLADRLVNATILVRNFRQDLYISNAALSCTYPLNSTTIYANGTYAISFTAPPLHGAYSILCNATKAGNLGSAEANFSSESRTTNATNNHTPFAISATNITLTQNYNFTFIANATNFGNGTAYFANFTLQIPGNWTASSLTYACNNITSGSSCIASFNITIANRTVPAIYPLNSTFYWTNPEGTIGSSLNTTLVTVTSNPILEIPELSFQSITAPGKTKRAGNFTLRSTGNDALANITYNVSGLPGITFDFYPSNLTSLSAGGQQSVQLNVTIPSSHASGDYQGTISIFSANGGGHTIDLNLTITGANVSISISPTSFNADNITQTQNQSFYLHVNITNEGNATAFFTNLSLQLPAGIYSNQTLFQCGNLSVGSNCSAAFAISALNATGPGNYLVNASAVWNDLESAVRANASVVNVSVLSNPVLAIIENLIFGNATHGTNATFGNFTVRNYGNDALSNVTFNISGLGNFSIVFFPGNITSLPAGGTQLILINATVPYAFDAGLESGAFNVTTNNGGSKELQLQLGISVDRSWLLAPQSCTKTESPDYGNVCEITINNTGNAPMDFSINPTSANFSFPNASNFSISKQSTFSFNVTYNITGQPKIQYNSTYAVNAPNPGSSPTSRQFVITLEPFASLQTSLLISPLVIQNSQNVTLLVNVTDSNLVGIQNVTAQVSMPNGTVFSFSLYQYNTIFNASGNITQWRNIFPNATGSTALAGNYSVSILSLDAIGINGSTSGTFYAYPKLQSTLQTLSSSYQKGATASIYYRARDQGGGAIPNANVTLTVRDAMSVSVFNQTYSTSSSGIVEPLPTFAIPSDAFSGNWTLLAYVSYFDANASATVTDSANSTFEVINVSSSNVTFSGLLTDFKSGDLFFGGDTIEFAISVYDVNGAPLDPNSMNITVFSPNESVYSLINLSQINRSSIGLYYYKFQVPRNITSGIYRAELNASRGSYFTRNMALFRISSSLFADIETSFVWYPSSVMTFRMIVYAGDGVPIDPTTLNLNVIDPAGNNYFSVGLASLTKQSTGYYIYNHAMGANTSTGNYYAYLNATKDSSVTYKLKPFRVSQGGPYDVRFELLQTQVYPGDYLDFRAVLENKGEVSQDVTLEYWVTDDTRTWFYGSEAILTPAFVNTTAIRSAYIFTTQGPGTYTLHGRVTYDLIKPPIDIAYTFLVTQRLEATPTSAPPSGPAVTPITRPSAGAASVTPTPPPYRDYSGMQIISYPDEVAIQAGETKYPKIQVKNTGLTPLHNVTVTLAGIPTSWLEVLPSRVNALAPGDVATFVIKISVPATEKTSIKNVRALALSSERKEEVRFDVAIFESKLALIEHQIQRLKERAGKLAKDAQEAEKVGKNMQLVWEAIEQGNKYIAQAEDELRGEQLDDALSNVQIADTYLAKANALLISAPFNPPTYTQLPNWITIALGIVGSGMGLLLFWFVRRKKKAPAQAPAAQGPSALEKMAQVMEKTDVASMNKEKSKIGRALRLLEEELTDGTISHDAYNELKKRYDRKLTELEKKLGRAGGY